MKIPGEASIPKRGNLTPVEIREIAAVAAEMFAENMDSVELGHMALARSIESMGEPDALRAQNKLREAQVLATLSLRDAITEATAAFKEVANRQIEGVA